MKRHFDSFCGVIAQCRLFCRTLGCVQHHRCVDGEQVSPF